MKRILCCLILSAMVSLTGSVFTSCSGGGSEDMDSASALLRIMEINYGFFPEIPEGVAE